MAAGRSAPRSELPNWQMLLAKPGPIENSVSAYFRRRSQRRWSTWPSACPPLARPRGTVSIAPRGPWRSSRP